MCEYDGEYTDNCPPGSTRIFFRFVMGKITQRIRQRGSEISTEITPTLGKAALKSWLFISNHLRNRRGSLSSVSELCPILLSGTAPHAWKYKQKFSQDEGSEQDLPYRGKIPTVTCSQSALLKLHQ